jgi:hypothetical protein
MIKREQICKDQESQEKVLEETLGRWSQSGPQTTDFEDLGHEWVVGKRDGEDTEPDSYFKGL